MPFPAVHFCGDWHALTQRIVRIGDDDAQAIHKIGTQIRRFHRFGVNSAVGEQTNLTVIRFIRTTVGIEQTVRARLRLAEVWLINVRRAPIPDG